MNDQDGTAELELLRRDHRLLDAQIADLIAAGATDQLELARLKKRKLLLKDQIQRIVDNSIPDIIA